jgi:hypothetical protein
MTSLVNQISKFLYKWHWAQSEKFVIFEFEFRI